MTRSRRDYRVGLVDDHALFAESLELALEMQGYTVHRHNLLEVTSLAALVTQVMRKRPQTVLLDIHLGQLGESTSMVATLARAGINVVIVTATTDRSLWGECVYRGARKVISKSAPLGEIMGVVRRLNLQQQVMTAAEREELLGEWERHLSRHAGARGRLDMLSTRERQVLGSLMSGLAVRDIAKAGSVSEGTVRTQVKSILAKLEVGTQLAAVGIAHEVNWRPPDEGR